MEHFQSLRFHLTQFVRLRLRGGGHVICDNRVGRVCAGVSRIPNRHHDEGHDRDNEGCPYDELDHFRTVRITMKAA